MVEERSRVGRDQRENFDCIIVSYILKSPYLYKWIYEPIETYLSDTFLIDKLSPYEPRLIQICQEANKMVHKTHVIN